VQSRNYYALFFVSFLCLLFTLAVHAMLPFLANKGECKVVLNSGVNVL